MTQDYTTAVEAIEAGNTTKDEIGEYVGKHPNSYNKKLKEWAEDPSTPITRTRDGREFVYSVEEPTEQESDLRTESVNQMLDGDDGRMPVIRKGPAYDWDSLVVQDAPEYIEYDTEVEEIEAAVEASDFLPVSVLLAGPSGCGKTQLVESISAKYDLPVFTIQGKYSLHEGDLLGSPTLLPDRSIWVDGPLTKALIASQERKVILFLDEGNRSRAEAKAPLLPATDDRCQVSLGGERGGEVVKGKRENLLVFTTINSGPGYKTQPMDDAEKRRLSGQRFPLDYLGRNQPAREATLIEERAEVPFVVAEMLVKTANEIRDLAEGDASVKKGVPTATLITWAKLARAYDMAGMDDPVYKAGVSSVVEGQYADEPGQSEVKQAIHANLKGCPVDESGAKEFRDGEREVFACDECGWQGDADDLSDNQHNWRTCPDCGTEGGLTESTVSF